MGKLPWVTSRGQIIQIVVPIIGLLAGAAVQTAVVAVAQKMTGASLDWWVLGVVFFGGALLMWWAQSLAKKQTVSLQPNIASRDDEKREEIRILFETYIRPLNKLVRFIEARLREHLRKSQTGKDRDLTLFFADYGKGISGRATGALESEFVIPETGGVDPLRRKLKEFSNAYHGYVACINHLVQFSSYPLKEDPDYEKWRDQHRLFHLELTKLIGKEKNPSTLKVGLDVNWPDILR